MFLWKSDFQLGRHHELICGLEPSAKSTYSFFAYKTVFLTPSMPWGHFKLGCPEPWVLADSYSGIKMCSERHSEVL